MVLVLLSFFIIHRDLSFGGFALKIEFVVFVYELTMKLFFLLTWLCDYCIYNGHLTNKSF